ncbi:MAG TPA: cysteine methyltransferase [Betaproteobacteria bacterium]|nr:cysteine methyltransferase [Betaproteobacteria bacterium]
MTAYQARLAAPLAVLGIRAEADVLTVIDFLPLDTAALAPQTSFAREICRQLHAYLANPRYLFDLPLRPVGTPFQQRVWREMTQIASGEVRCYGELAQALGSSPRAVGGACGANPIPLVIPCHRVVGKNSVGGFMRGREAGPLAIKHWLLRHEACRD